jgi:hypothetical protein
MVPTTDGASLYPVAREILLGQGDVIALRLPGTTDCLPTVRVALGGTIQPALIGSFRCTGRRLINHRALEAKMSRRTRLWSPLSGWSNCWAPCKGRGRRHILDKKPKAGSSRGEPPPSSHSTCRFSRAVLRAGRWDAPVWRGSRTHVPGYGPSPAGPPSLPGRRTARSCSSAFGPG